MKRLKILIISFLIFISIFALVSMQANAQLTASKLVFSSGGAQSLTVNTVSAAIVVQRQDVSSNPVSIGTSAITVALSSSGAGTFYSNVAGTTVITSIQIAAGSSSSASFYYKGTVVGSGTHTLTAASSPLTSATTPFTISAANPVASKLVFSSGGAQSLTVNTVSAAIVVQRQDVSSNPVSTGTSAITVALSSSGAGTFYSDVAGTTVITSIQIAAGSSSSASFYYKGTVVGSGTHTLTAASSPLTSATTPFTISAANPVASKLVFSSGGAQSLTVNTVSAAIVVQRQDVSSNPVSTGTSAITVALSSSGAGTFYSDVAGTTVITSIQIAAGSSSSASFYYKGTVVGSGTHTLTAASSPLTSATTPFTISAANPVASKLVFSSGGAQSLTVNTVSAAIVVQRQDVSSNPVSTGTSAITVALSSSGAGTFYSDVAGTTVITSIQIAAGSSSSASFYYKGTVVGSGTHTLTAASSPLTSATTPFTISAANPVASKLVFSSGGAQSLTVNTVSAAIVVQRQDVSSNPVSTGTSAITVALSSSGAGTFYSDVAGTTVITSIQIAAGSSSSASFYYKGTVVGSGTHTLTAASSPLTSATTPFTISAANPVASKLVFSSGGAQSLTVNTVSAAIVVQRQDVSSNPVSTGTSAITVALSSSGAGTFYSDVAGTTVITSIQIAAGSSSSASFYYKGTVVGSGTHTLTAASSPLTSATTPFTISAANPVASKLVFSSGGAQSLTAGVVSPTAIVVQRQDVLGNPVSDTSAVTVGLSTTSVGGAFYSNVGGTTPIDSIVIAAGANSSAGFYYKDTVIGTPTLFGGGNSALASATTQFTITAGALDHFVFNTITTQAPVIPFSITIKAVDLGGNTVASYNGSNTLSVSLGAISPISTTAFTAGVWTGSVTLSASDSGIIVFTSGSSKSGASNSFVVTIAPTPTPTPSLEPTPTPTPTPSLEPTPTPTPTPSLEPTPTPTPTPTLTSNPTPTSPPTAISTPTPKPSPSPTPLETTVKAQTDTGSIVNLAIRGNVTSLQMFDVRISTNHSAISTTVSFYVKGESGTTGFSNITIPKTAILFGTTPLVFIDGQKATSQGYTQDPENFNVWYTTQFSTHQLTIQFLGPSTSQVSSFWSLLAVGIIAPEIILVYAVIAVRRLRRRPENR